jgi:predicted TIM-barrel fold metal-dependent hydrolase
MYTMNSKPSKNWVDTHFHVFNAGVATKTARYIPKYTAALQDWMALAQSVGVARGVWVQPSFLGTDNSLMVSALEAHPQTLRGVAVIAPDTSLNELKVLHRAGVRGLRLNLSGVSHEIPEWTKAETVWSALHELGWHLEVHTDQGGLSKVLMQLPSDIPLVVDHMGKPHQAHAKDASLSVLIARSQRVPTYVKLSGAYRLGEVDPTTLAPMWLHELGAGALLWGSDWPCTNHEHLASYQDLFCALQSWVGDEHLNQVLSLNPQRLYWSHNASL